MEIDANAGFAVTDGITADECDRTSAPDIFAAGDDAWHPSRHRHRGGDPRAVRSLVGNSSSLEVTIARAARRLF